MIVLRLLKMEIFLINFKLNKMGKQCKRSYNGIHVWNEPRLEDSIDKDRAKETILYCTLCYETKKLIQLRKNGKAYMSRLPKGNRSQ